jgi:hypothetical protein
MSCYYSGKRVAMEIIDPRQAAVTREEALSRAAAEAVRQQLESLTRQAPSLSYDNDHINDHLCNDNGAHHNNNTLLDNDGQQSLTRQIRTSISSLTSSTPIPLTLLTSATPSCDSSSSLSASSSCRNNEGRNSITNAVNSSVLSDSVKVEPTTLSCTPPPPSGGGTMDQAPLLLTPPSLSSSSSSSLPRSMLDSILTSVESIRRCSMVDVQLLSSPDMKHEADRFEMFLVPKVSPLANYLRATTPWTPPKGVQLPSLSLSLPSSGSYIDVVPLSLSTTPTMVNQMPVTH